LAAPLAALDGPVGLDDTVGMTLILEVVEHAALEEQTQKAKVQKPGVKAVAGGSLGEFYWDLPLGPSTSATVVEMLPFLHREFDRSLAHCLVLGTD